MKNILTFAACPDYCFSSDELDTILIWPETVQLDDELVECLHTREITESGEIIEHRIYGWPMPADGAEYAEMLENIISGGGTEIELV